MEHTMIRNVVIKVGIWIVLWIICFGIIGTIVTIATGSTVTIGVETVAFVVASIVINSIVG
jgi:hypothetical protein